MYLKVYLKVFFLGTYPTREEPSMTTTHDDATTWRDLSDQLNPEQVARLKELERDPGSWAHVGPPLSRSEVNDALLGWARGYARDNLAAAVLPDVPTPAGAEHDGTWAEDDLQPYRVIYGVSRGVVGHQLALQTSALQYADGNINTTDDPPRVSLDIHYDSGLTSDQARDLAASLIEAATEVDGWVAR